MKKSPQTNVSSINLDSLYVLTKGINGVKAKFIGVPWMGSVRKMDPSPIYFGFWSLMTNTTKLD